MNKQKTFILTIVLISLLCGAVWGVYFYFKSKSDVAITPEEINKNLNNITYINASTDLISPDSPLPNSTVGKKFNVLGKARGTYFFEGSFPITLLDKDGKVLVETFTKAQGEWMTEDFVSFSGVVEVPKTYSGPATLVFKKDNPSDDRKLDASISFPINIQ